MVRQPGIPIPQARDPVHSQCVRTLRRVRARLVRKTPSSLREGYGYITDSGRCTLCQECIRHCYISARKLQGVEYTPEELVAELRKDEAFFRQSGGGVTFSGGEPLLQADFVCRTAELLHEHGIPSLVETCGYASSEAVQKAAGVVDAFFYDYKHPDPEIHRQLTARTTSRSWKTSAG